MPANEPASGRSRGAAGLVQKRAGLIVADWRRASETGDTDLAAALKVIIEALERCGGATRSAHRHVGADEVFAANAQVLSGIDAGAVTSLRDVLRRQVLLALPAAQALAALHCISAVLDELLRTVTRMAAEDLERLAYVDELTGLANRRTANEAVHAAVAQAVRYRHDLVAVVIDVDHLKSVNDREGHDAGDATLRRLADAFRVGLRDGDRAFRTGGDEFLVLLPETKLADVPSVMDRVRAAGAPPFSFGAASAPDEADTAATLIRIADQRLLAWRRDARAPIVPAPRRHAHRTRAAVVIATILAVGLAALRWSEVLTVPDAGIAAAVGVLAGGVALLGIDVSRELRSQLAGAVMTPMIIYTIVSVGLHAMAPPTPPRTDRAELSRTTSSMTASSAGRSAIAELIPTTRRPASAKQPVTTTPTSLLVTKPPIWVATSTTSTTAAPPPTTSTTTTSTPPSTTTTTAGAPAPSTTSTTVAARSAEAGGGEDEADGTGDGAGHERARGRGHDGDHEDDPAGPDVRDDHVRSGRPTLDIHVLRNDVAADDGPDALNPDSLVIVSRPERGQVEVRSGGVVRYHGGDAGPVERFRYRVCTYAGRCGEAWVYVDRRPR